MLELPKMGVRKPALLCTPDDFKEWAEREGIDEPRYDTPKQPREYPCFGLICSDYKDGDQWQFVYRGDLLFMVSLLTAAKSPQETTSLGAGAPTYVVPLVAQGVSDE